MVVLITTARTSGFMVVTKQAYIRRGVHSRPGTVDVGLRGGEGFHFPPDERFRFTRDISLRDKLTFGALQCVYPVPYERPSAL